MFGVKVRAQQTVGRVDSTRYVYSISKLSSPAACFWIISRLIVVILSLFQTKKLYLNMVIVMI